jgi:ABC-2 type transport system ATP-binding protein
LIEVQNLTKAYGPVTAVDHVSFTVNKGEILGFLGPNGAGKTTTMRILTGFMPASSGTARVAGFDVSTDSLEVRRHIGYLPEAPPLYPDMAVETLILCCELRMFLPNSGVLVSRMRWRKPTSGTSARN